MKLAYIREYLLVAETLNFSAAAKALYISQPTLSRHIQVLEKDLGYALVQTSSHGVELTEFGKAALRPFRKMLKEYQSVLEQGRKLAQQVSGSITVGLLYYAIDDYYADFLTYFKEKYANVELNCRSYLPQALFEDLNSGKVDVAALFYLEKDPPPELVCQKIAATSMVAVLREDNPLCHQDSVTLEELSAYPLVELKDDAYSRQITKSLLDISGTQFSKTTQADNVEMVPFTLRMTGGVHITGESCQRQNAASVQYRPIRGKNLIAAMGFCRMEDNSEPLVKLFFEEAQRFFST